MAWFNLPVVFVKGWVVSLIVAVALLRARGTLLFAPLFLWLSFFCLDHVNAQKSALTSLLLTIVVVASSAGSCLQMVKV
jgi:hypothetical protein